MFNFLWLFVYLLCIFSCNYVSSGAVKHESRCVISHIKGEHKRLPFGPTPRLALLCIRLSKAFV